MTDRHVIPISDAAKLEQLGGTSTGLHALEAIERIFHHDEPAGEEMQGRLSRSERERITRGGSAPSQNEIDQAMVGILINEPIAPEEIFSVWSAEMGGPPDGVRENAHLALRHALAYAISLPTPANYEALVRAVIESARLGMNDAALLAISVERVEQAKLADERARRGL